MRAFRLFHRRVFTRRWRGNIVTRSATIFRRQAAGVYVPISLIYVKETGTPKENIANGSIPLCKPPRFAHLCTSWTKPQKLCPTVDDSLHYSFTVLLATTYERREQQQKRKPNAVFAFLRGGATERVSVELKLDASLARSATTSTHGVR